MIKNKQHHLAMLAQFIGSNGFNISDRDNVQNAIETLVRDKHRQHGFRIEGMFAYVAGALGKCTLVKQEEGGVCFSAEADLGIPDYRIILSDGSAFFAQVKSCSDMSEKFSERYIQKQMRYAALNKLPLKIAIYWRVIQHWTLNPVENFTFTNGSYKLSLGKAMATSEMAILGDRIIGTLAPLKLRLIMDPNKTTPFDESGQCQVTIGATEIYCVNTLIEDETEKNIAFKLILSGKWEETDEVIVDGDRVVSMDYTYSPRDEPTDNSFNIVASLSSIISASYDNSTIEDGQVKKIQPDNEPALFEVAIPEDYKGKYLPLWQLIQRPNLNFKEECA